MGKEVQSFVEYDFISNVRKRGNPDEMLDLGRERLQLSREIMFFSLLSLVNTWNILNDTQRSNLINLYGGGFQQEGLITEHLIVPAKIEKNITVTVPEAEEAARKHAGDYTESHGLSRKVGEALVESNIKHTKRIQRGMGVRNPRSPRPIFTASPAPKAA